jgi:eukaryotic-like serine/threonine-protein kinase
MGLVYRAFDRELGHDVALKTLRSALPDDIYHLKREFRALLDLDHPNLVHLYDLVVASNQCFFTMELIEGPRVDHWVRAQSSGSALSRRAASAVWQLGLGLGALHNAGKLHRDIKPSNVLVTPDDRVVLLDMGLVSHFMSNRSQRSQHGQLAGTLEYMAPEQGRGELLTPAADWFAVGVVIYEALTGSLPWPEAGRQHFGQSLPSPEPPHLRAAGISPELSRLVLDLLDANPGNRPLQPDVMKRLEEVDFERPTPAPALASRAKTTIVGRSRELAQLHAAYEAAEEGQSKIVCIRGSSGIGKTALVERFVDGLDETAQAAVFRSRCHYRELIPFKGIDGIVDQLTRFLVKRPARELEKLLPRSLPELARMFPVLERVRVYAPTLGYNTSSAHPTRHPDPLVAEVEHRAQRDAFACLREILARIAATTRLVLWIDDVQWSDLDSVRLLKSLLRTASPVLFLFSFRAEDATHSPPLKSLLAHIAESEPRARVEWIDVVPLSVDEVEVLASELLDSHRFGPDVARRAAENAHGSPFFLRELIRDLTEDEGSTAAGSLEHDVAELIRARVARLPDPARELVELIAIAGCPLAEHIARRSFEAGGENALSVLRNQSLLRIAPVGGSRGFDVYHDQVREAINAGLSVERKRHLHRKLAHLLEGLADSDPHVLVHHFLMAEQPERAALAARSAADRARGVLAFELEASLVERSLELGVNAEDTWLAHRRIANALSNAGRGSDAAAAFVKAANFLAEQSPGHPDIAKLRVANAEHLLRCGILDQGLDAMYEALRASRIPHQQGTFGAVAWALANRPRVSWHKERHKRRKSPQPTSESDEHTLGMLWSAGVGLSAFFPMRAMEFQVRHSVLAYKTGALPHVARALSTEAIFLSLEGSEKSVREADALQLEAVRISERSGDPVTGVHVAMNTAAIAFFTGRLTQAAELADRAIALCEEYGEMGWERVNSRLFSLGSLGLLGELAELRERQSDGIEEARERGDRYALSCYSVGLPSAVWLADDELPRLRSLAQEALDCMPSTTPSHFMAVLTLAHADLYEGNPEAALKRTMEEWPALKKSFNLRIAFMRMEAMFLRGRVTIACAAKASEKERTRLVKLARADVRSLRDERFAYANHYADCIEACIAVSNGDKALAVELLERAALGFTTLRMGMHAAACRFELAEQLASEQHRSRANFWFDANGVVRPANLCWVFVPVGEPRRPLAKDSSRQSS